MKKFLAKLSSKIKKVASRKNQKEGMNQAKKTLERDPDENKYASLINKALREREQMENPQKKHEEAMNRYENQSNTYSKKPLLRDGYNYPLESLFGLIWVVHIFDALVLGFSISNENMALRLTVYFLLGGIAYALTRNYSDSFSIKEILILTLIPTVIIPLIHHLLILLGTPENIIKNATTITLFVPWWIFYLVMVKNIRYAPSVLENYSGLSKVFLNVVSPLRFSSKFLIVFLLFMLASFTFANVSQAVEDNRFATEGIDVWGGVTNLGTMVTSTYTNVADNFRTILGAGTSVFQQQANRTFGWDYVGEVDRYSENRGVTLDSSFSQNYFLEGQEIIYGMTLSVESFEEGIDVEIRCHLQDRNNRSNRYEGNVFGSEVYSVQITNTGSESFTCDFDENTVQPGDYRLHVTARFPFETWGTTTYTFLGSETHQEIVRSGENPIDVLEINPHPELRYTGGPVALLMANSRVNTRRTPMPIVASTETGRDNNFVVNAKIENNDNDGIIKSVDSMEFRLPEQLSLRNCNAGTPRTEPDERFAGRIEGDSYLRHIFENIRYNEENEEYTMGCVLNMPGEDMRNFLTSRGDRSFTVNAVANYIYELEYTSTITMEERDEIT